MAKTEHKRKVLAQIRRELPRFGVDVGKFGPGHIHEPYWYRGLCGVTAIFTMRNGTRLFVYNIYSDEEGEVLQFSRFLEIEGS